MVLSGHTHCVTCVKWGGEGLLYTASQDRTIKVWRAKDVSHCSGSLGCHGNFYISKSQWDRAGGSIQKVGGGERGQSVQSLNGTYESMAKVW